MRAGPDHEATGAGPSRAASAAILLAAACLAALLASCYGSALFADGQFAYRDASHYYYPLYLRVQQEWRAGRLPLWDPHQNAGAPLLGNPTAAVLYPGKLVFAALPYPWALRAYVVLHTALACLGMGLLLRWWGVGASGATLGALAYGFGAPILFLHCNVVYLVGAAWMPLGLREADRWLRAGRRPAIPGLAAVLALQVLGGDPQAAYLTALASGGYALGLGWADRPGSRPVARLGPKLAGAVVGWSVLAIAAAPWLPASRSLTFEAVRIAAWLAVGAVVVVRCRRDAPGRRLLARLGGLIAAGVLGLALSGAQTVPALEQAWRSVRASEVSPLDEYAGRYELEPIRAVEWVWPNVFGPFFDAPRYWLQLLPPRGDHSIWVPSLYLGGLATCLALGAFGFRGGPPWRAWLSALAVAGVLASLGTATSPLAWWSGPAASGTGGDPARRGVGGVYWALTTLLPAFGAFRFPAKLLSVTTLALAALAGLGWERITSGRSTRARAIAVALLVASVTALILSLAGRTALVAALAARAERPDVLFGPRDVPGAVDALQQSLLHGSLALAGAVALLAVAPRRPRVAGPAALVALTVDLALANSGLVLTVPQSEFDAVSKGLEAIREAERAEPTGGPFRVHHLGYWAPPGWSESGSPDRWREWVARERDTLVPLHGITRGVEYTYTAESATQSYDYWLFFRPFPLRLDPRAAASLQAEPGLSIRYYPRRGFDLWNTRYFILPAYAAGWTAPERSYAAFLEQTELVYPPPEALRGAGSGEARRRWLEQEDVQVRRNRAAFPRAWIVHEARFRKPIVGLAEEDRAASMADLLYQGDALWNVPGRPVLDLRRAAILEVDDPRAVAARLPGAPAANEAGESVTVRESGPQRVVLSAVLERPGLVVLADLFDPGWRLAIDGIPAPILKANRLMRAALVDAGTHTLVFTYDPSSVRIGAGASAAGLLTIILLGSCRPRGPRRDRSRRGGSG